MGTRRRKNLSKKYPWLRLTRCWPKAGMGRELKRRLSKARRRLTKEMLAGRGHERGIATHESNVNWRGW